MRESDGGRSERREKNRTPALEMIGFAPAPDAELPRKELELLVVNQI